jgi:hypothetical protein
MEGRKKRKIKIKNKIKIRKLKGKNLESGRHREKAKRGISI